MANTLNNATNVVDDQYLGFGTGGDFRFVFDSASGELRITDGTNTLFTFTDGGTTGSLACNLALGSSATSNVWDLWIPTDLMFNTTANSTTQAMGGQTFNVLGFDAATEELARFQFAIPTTYNGEDFICTVYWVTAGAPAGNVLWRIRLRGEADGDAFGGTFGDVNGTAGQPTAATTLKKTAITVTPANTAAGANMVGIVSRLGADGSDTETADALLLGVHLELDRS